MKNCEIKTNNYYPPTDSELMELQASVIRLTPLEGKQKIMEITGQEVNLINAAKTAFFDESHGEAVILINSELDPKIQDVLLVHETVQLSVIRDWLATERPIQSILSKAHEIGLSAGIRYAERLGIKVQYLSLREKWDDDNRKRYRESR